MPAGPRIRANSNFGLTTDNPLTMGATTFNSARLSLFPVVSAAHAVVTLDPRAVNGEPEIVIITAHTAAATVATISRGAYGTVARSHPVGTEWVHAPIDEDVIEVLTSSTRPSDPYAGQFIFETDTDKFVARNAANGAWVDAVPLVWDTTSWTPTLAAGWSVGAGTTVARFAKIGRIVFYHLRIIFGAGASFGAAAFTFTPPFNFALNNSADTFGQVVLFDADGGSYTGVVGSTGVSSAIGYRHNVSGANIIRNTITNTTPFTWAVSDRFVASGHYESDI